MLSRLKAFFDERFAASSVWGELLRIPLPGGASWFRSIHGVVLALFTLAMLTGIALGAYYAPSSQTAWASVHFVQYRVPGGALVRALHHWSSQMLIVVVFAQLVRGVLAGSYREPREGVWWHHLGLFGLVLGLVHTGTFLPWDQRAYWIARVEAGIASTVPVVGGSAARQLQGDATPGSLLLTRMYLAHVVLLPILSLAVLAGIAVLTRKVGATGAEDEDAAAEEPYFPGQAARDAVIGLCVVLATMLLAKRSGAPFDAPADPNVEYPARPEWFLLGLFRLRKSFEGRYEVVPLMVLPGLVLGYLAILPFVDRAKSSKLRQRLVPVSIALLLLGGLAGITVNAVRADARDTHLAEARHRADQRAGRAMRLAMNGVTPDGPAEMVRNDPAVRPKELYDELCAVCHAEAGTPLRDRRGERTNARAPVLEGFGSAAWARAVMTHPSSTELFGRTTIDGMPPQGRRLRREGDDAMNAVAEYLAAQGREANDPPANAALVQRGDEIYHRKCTSCHQGAGDQTETPDEEREAPDLTGWGSRAWIREQILHPEARGHYGSEDKMGSFADRLQGRDLEWVVNYVRSLRSRAAPTLQEPAENP